MDLAALNQVARLFDPRVERDEIQQEFERFGELEDTPSAECDVWGSERPLALGQLALPATHVARRQIPEEFFYFNWP
jgi:hypothetical protein